jgi:hypothetical protein
MEKNKLIKDEQIMARFNSKRNKVEILWEALDYMQQYNGRTKVQCIGLALGYSYDQMESCN